MGTVKASALAVSADLCCSCSITAECIKCIFRALPQVGVSWTQGVSRQLVSRLDRMNSMLVLYVQVNPGS